MKWLGFLSKTFSLGRILAYGSIAVAAAFAAGTWTGSEWQQGRQAQALLEEQADARVEADRISGHQDAQARRYERERERRAAAARRADRDLAAWLDTRPDLWDCDIGARGLQLIRSWDAAGTGGDTGQPADPVPDAAAGPTQR